MPDSIESLLLGLLQGTTAFLPISSSAHLLLGQYFFSMDQERFGLTFDMTLHLVTLLAVVLFYWRELSEMARAVLGSLRRPDLSEPRQRLAYLIALATLPAAAVGFLFREFFEDTLRSPWVVVAGFAASGLLFLFAESLGTRESSSEKLSFKGAAFIGVGQVFSLLYGVSRSGSTLAFGLFAGLERTEAAKFSFLMSIPITAGAIASEAPAMLSQGMAQGDLPLYVIGFVASAVTAYISIKFLLAFFTRYSLRPFAYYLFAGAAVVAGALLIF